MQIQINTNRLAQIKYLDKGAHDDFESGVCAMEAASYIAGEPWSDHPQCVCPIIGAFMRAWNDGLLDKEERTSLLKPLIVRVIGTKGSAALEERRSLMAADWLVRTHTPAWLRLAELVAQAETLENLPEITSMAQVPSIRGPIEAVRKDADAAWAAAWAAAGDAAWAAAWAAAGAAAGAAARDAAWAAAWAAARAAARDAAGAKLKPTRDRHKASAADLISRMIDLKEAA